MNKIYWIFGCTASGKEMFIKNAVSKNKEITLLLDWEDKAIIPVFESILYVGRYYQDPITEKRIQIIPKVAQIVNENENAIILIKGQIVDLKMDLVNRLRETLPNLEHEIIFLHADLSVVFERGKKRIWFNENDNDINKWQERITRTVESVKKHLSDYKITSFDTTNGYKITDFPEFENNFGKAK